MNKLISLTGAQELALMNIVNLANKVLGADCIGSQLQALFGVFTQTGLKSATVEEAQAFIDAQSAPVAAA